MKLIHPCSACIHNYCLVDALAGECFSGLGSYLRFTFCKRPLLRGERDGTSLSFGSCSSSLRRSLRILETSVLDLLIGERIELCGRGWVSVPLGACRRMGGTVPACMWAWCLPLCARNLAIVRALVNAMLAWSANICICTSTICC
jgi:hypothetical protein